MKEITRKKIFRILILAVIGVIANASYGCDSDNNADENEKYIKDALWKDIYNEQSHR